jgi:hypothetical protein
MQNVGWVDHTGQLLLDFAEAIHRAAAEAGLQAGPPPGEKKGSGKKYPLNFCPTYAILYSVKSKILIKCDFEAISR